MVKQYREETPSYATSMVSLRNPVNEEETVEHDSVAHIVDDLDYQEAVEYNDNAEMTVGGNTLQDMELEMIKRTLQENHGRRNATAAALNISERTLYRKLKEYDLFEPKRKK